MFSTKPSWVLTFTTPMYPYLHLPRSSPFFSPVHIFSQRRINTTSPAGIFPRKNTIRTLTRISGSLLHRSSLVILQETCCILRTYIMNNLPQELVDHISSYLSHKDLKSTLLLSRKFQFAAEQFSEAFTDFALTSSNASNFMSTYSGRRSNYLQNVSFATSVFSREDEAEEDCRDTANEVKLMDEDFTCQIRFLFQTLKAVETRLDSVYSLGKIHLTVYTPTRAINEEGYCLHVKFVSWRVHLLSPSTLPSLTSVRSLTVETPEQTFCGGEPVLSLRKPDLRMLLDISSKLPHLEFL